MNIKDFSNGIITRVHPHIIPQASSIEYHNCENEGVSLCPIKLPTVEEDVEVGKRWIYDTKCDRVVSSNGDT